MTDKPLDCVGIDPTKQEVGKHDFRPSPTEPIVHAAVVVPGSTRMGFAPDDGESGEGRRSKVTRCGIADE